MVKLNRRNFCQCGCGTVIKTGNRFVNGHNRNRAGATPWNKGLKGSDYANGGENLGRWERTEEHNKRNSESRKEFYSNPENRKALSENTIKQFADHANREKHSQIAKALWQDPVYKGKTLEGNRVACAKPEKRKKISINSLRQFENPENRKKLSRIVAKWWAELSEDKKTARLSKWMKSVHMTPNKQESLLGEMLEDLFPGEYRYTGDRSFWINGKNPDFANINGQKKIIEFYGDYFHKGQNPQDRIDIFKPFGWDTLVIWEKELKNPLSLVDKLLQFHQS